MDNNNLNDEKVQMTDQEAKEILEKGYKKAEKILEDEDKFEKFLNRLESKLQKVPVGGSVFSMIPAMISMLRSYFKKEYRDIPIGTLLALISALLYWLAPIDVVPDTIPGLGYIDDAGVIAACLKLINDDLKEYKEWKEENENKEKVLK